MQETEQFTDDGIIQKAKNLLAQLCEEREVEYSHGIIHASNVLDYMNEALNYSTLEIPRNRQISMKLAALLHDASDRKYFKNECNDFHIMFKALSSNDSSQIQHPDYKEIINDALYMISLVSSQKNGNDIPGIVQVHPELLWPRYCDRLDSIGCNGIARCYLYSINKTQRPLFLPTTPRAKNECEIWYYASDARYKQYQTKGQSESMMDCYFDRLFQASKFNPKIVQNDWIMSQALIKIKPMIQFALDFGQTGEINKEMLDFCVKSYQSRDFKN